MGAGFCLLSSEQLQDVLKLGSTGTTGVSIGDEQSGVQQGLDEEGNGQAAVLVADRG